MPHDTRARIADNSPPSSPAGALRRTPIPETSNPSQLARIVVLADGETRPGGHAAWLGALRSRLPPSVAMEVHPAPVIDALASRSDALDHAALAAGTGLTVLLAAGTELPPHAWSRLLGVAATTAKTPAVITPLCADTPGLEPWNAGFDTGTFTLLQLDSGCFVRSARMLSSSTTVSTRISVWPAALLHRWAARPRGESLASFIVQTPAVLCDHLLVGTAQRSEQRAGTPASAAIAALRTVFAANPTPCWPGLDGKPVILHVSHGWGGGVARFIEDLAFADTARTHLVLNAHGAAGGPLGRELTLRLVGAPNEPPPLRFGPLEPEIMAISDQHAGYRELLAYWIRDFAVSQIWISSLLGHSLEALRSGLPTVVVNHDYSAWWPELHADFGDRGRSFDGNELEKLVASGVDFAPMPLRGAAEVMRQRGELLQALIAARPTMIAPSASLRSNLLRIQPALHGFEWQVVAHAVRPFTAAQSPVSSGIPDGRPRLLIPGRLNGGKGDVLLGQMIEALAALADVWLLGCGSSFERYLGVSGVHIVFDYARDDLPALLARIRPQLALLPASVSESYSYLLSELQALGVPVLATSLGAFRDRIEDGVDGFLVAADADEIVSAVGDLLAKPENLRRVRESLAARPPRTLASMLEDYASLLPRAARRGYPLYRHDSRAIAVDVLRSSIAAATHRIAALEAALDAAQHDLEQRAQWVARTESLFRDRSHELAMQCDLSNALNADLSIAIDHRAQAQAATAAAQAQTASAEAETIATQHELHRAEAVGEALAARIDEMTRSRSWRITTPLRRLTTGLRRLRAAMRFRIARIRSRTAAVRRSVASRGLFGTVAHARARQRGQQPSASALLLPVASAFAPFSVPRSDAPRASIVVPVFNHFEHTLACLRALGSTFDDSVDPGFEVIVVNDASTDETAARLADIKGLIVVHQPANAGFIAACNAGLARAQGEFVVMLNNDTAVQSGWLRALLTTFEQFPDTGLAGAKLVYPDGRLQEAGGIVFCDASGWNYGRFEDPADPRFDYVREVDYCSGAAIALPRALLEALGGFDPHYTPAYYEDTDLAMRVRARGLKVRYQPAAVVVHFEGVSSGTDETTGTKRYQPINQAKFRERWHAELRHHPAPGAAIETAREHRVCGRLLIVDACTPMPDHDSGSLRMWNLMRMLVEMGWKVVFFAENLAHHGRYTEALQGLGVEALFHPQVSSMPAWLAEHGRNFDAVMLSRHTVATPIAPLVREYAPQARLIFDTVDLHFLREQRAAKLAEADPELERAVARTRDAELALVRGSDVTVVVSEVERDLLLSLEPTGRVELLSNVHELAAPGLPFDERHDLIFIGGFQHEPNVDAVEWFLGAIWPHVARAMPSAQFNVVGSRMPEELRARCVALGERVVVHGFVADLQPLLSSARVAVAPLRYGAGVKGKVNQAMAHGVPVVATPLAVEGMHVEDGLTALVAADPRQFADAIVRVYNDGPLWHRLAAAGRANVARHFSFESARAALQHILPAR